MSSLTWAAVDATRTRQRATSVVERDSISGGWHLANGLSDYGNGAGFDKVTGFNSIEIDTAGYLVA